MLKLKNKKMWITALSITFVILSISFFSQPSSVRAMLGNTHIADVLIRFINEIVLKSPAGQYYMGLSWKHADDLNRIYDTPEYLEHRMKLIQLIEMFNPGMESLLDGKGDTVQITQEQISLLQSELDWVASVAEPPLQEDIEKELQRFPLENFIGMTMGEALDYVNSTWTDEAITPFATVVIANEVCLIGIGSDCLEKQNLVPDSNGLWAFYIHNGIYFEYPVDWRVQYLALPQIDEFTILQESGSFDEENNIIIISFTFLDMQNAPIENWDQVLPFLLSQQNCTDNQWQNIQITHFQGFECFQKDTDLPAGRFVFFFYNENQRLGIQLKVNVLDEHLLEVNNDLNSINDIFPNLQRIVKNIRILDEQ